MVTYQLTYEHTNASGTIGFKTKNIRTPILFNNKGVDTQEAGTGKAYDDNRWKKVFKFTVTMSAADYKTL